MARFIVAIQRYTTPFASVQRAVELCNGLRDMRPGAKVFVKPNIVFWSKALDLPEFGVITTSRVVHDMVALLKDKGVGEITIGEGSVLHDPKDKEVQENAFERLGYNELKKRYGVKTVNISKGKFRKVELSEGVWFKYNADFLESDFVVNLPVLKTHAQTIVSLGIKNLKGTIDVNSRKRCHSAAADKDLHFMVAKLADPAPPMFTLIDGIFTNERGPGFDGKIRRSDLLVGSTDVLSADLVAATILGYEGANVPHLAHAARNRGRTPDLADIEIKGETVADTAMKLDYTFPYNEDDTLPLPMAKMGIEGLAYHKYDLTMCTYCSILTGIILTAIARAWKGAPWDDVEILTGKVMKPSGRKHSILIGKCLYDALKDDPAREGLTFIKGCPPNAEQIIQALHGAGIDVDPATLRNLDAAAGMHARRYAHKPEFDKNLFRVVCR